MLTWRESVAVALMRQAERQRTRNVTRQLIERELPRIVRPAHGEQRLSKPETECYRAFGMTSKPRLWDWVDTGSFQPQCTESPVLTMSYGAVP
jgi:hypothetical protein